MDHNPFKPIEVDFDLRPLLDMMGVPYQELEGPTMIKSGPAVYEPIEIPEGLDEFLDFSYGTKRGE